MKDKILLAVSQYQLSELAPIYEQPDRAVYAAQSAVYGPVILKLSKYIQLKEEYDMLRQLKGNGCCKVYAYDEQNGILLEERLIPGTVLRKESDLKKRLTVFKDVFNKIHRPEIEALQNGHSSKDYLDWLTDIKDFIEKEDTDVLVSESMKEKICLAKQICEEMFIKYTDRLLLHGDLHHDNILLTKGGSYAMIDPKGVIGPEILDLPRFIMNELDAKHNCTDEAHMMQVVQLVSKTFGFPILDIAKVYFMEVILGNAWCMEDGDAINETEITIAEKVLHDIHGETYTTACIFP